MIKSDRILNHSYLVFFLTFSNPGSVIVSTILAKVSVVPLVPFVSKLGVGSFVGDVMVARNKGPGITLVILLEHVGMLAVEELLPSQIIVECPFVPVLVEEVGIVLRVVEHVVFGELVFMVSVPEPFGTMPFLVDPFVSKPDPFHDLCGVVVVPVDVVVMLPILGRAPNGSKVALLVGVVDVAVVNLDVTLLSVETLVPLEPFGSLLAILELVVDQLDIFIQTAVVLSKLVPSAQVFPASELVLVAVSPSKPGTAAVTSPESPSLCPTTSIA